MFHQKYNDIKNFKSLKLIFLKKNNISLFYNILQINQLNHILQMNIVKKNPVSDKIDPYLSAWVLSAFSSRGPFVVCWFSSIPDMLQWWLGMRRTQSPFIQKKFC